MAALFRFIGALGALSIGLSFLAGGCKKEPEVKNEPGKTCAQQHGVEVEIDGQIVCEERCNVADCAENNVCVGNRCKLLCEAHSDCQSYLDGDPITQACVVANADTEAGVNTGEAVFVCETSKVTVEVGLPCPIGPDPKTGISECDGFIDFDGSPLKTCPDGTACSLGGCPVEHCKPLMCQSLGLHDAEAYCTTVDCTTNADCAPGYYCGVVRRNNPICGVPNKGDEDLPCIDPANNDAVGGTYMEGPISLLQRACLKPEPCVPCENQQDCSLLPDMACVTISDGNFCAKTCFANEDCPDDFVCAGAAAPQLGFCVPRSGTCKPPETNNFCYNCINDLDCGPGGPGSTVGCIDLTPPQRGCFDFSFPDECVVDGDCPKSPSGRAGECLDAGENVPASDPLYHHCYVPLTTGGFQCWPPN